MDTGSRFEPSQKLVTGVWIGLAVLIGAFLIFAGVLRLLHPPPPPQPSDPTLITNVHFENIICPGCGSQQRAISTKEDNQPWVTYAQLCTQCGHVLPKSQWIRDHPPPLQDKPMHPIWGGLGILSAAFLVFVGVRLFVHP
ncbi:MAG: hypothetical protein KAV00_03315 [Phycisphaerae bacterium]|nr:hypothetical protein [Phycisphaerae bacterium]